MAMKTSLTILTAVLALCGCAHRQAPSTSHRAIDLIQPGRAVAWSNGSVLEVGQRDGNSLQDIRFVGKAADGQETTITARTGTLQPGSVENPEDANCVRITFPEAQGLHAGSRFTVRDLTLILKR